MYEFSVIAPGYGNNVQAIRNVFWAGNLNTRGVADTPELA